MKYKTKVNKLIKSGFRIYGIGNFDLSNKEIEKLLELLDKNKEKDLIDYYNYLAKFKL